MNSCDMLTSFLLGELSDSEARLFKEHTETCHKCRAELHDLMHINNKLISVGDDDLLNLPSNLKARTLQKAFAARPPVTPPGQKNSWRLNRSRLLIVAVATFMLGVVLGRFSTVTPTVKTPTTPAQLLNKLKLVSTDDTHATGMAMVYRQDQDMCLVVYVQHMQPLTEYGCYSVWETIDGYRRNLGDFTVDQNGDAVILLKGGDLHDTESISITHEPAWNDPKPRGPVVLVPTVKRT
ncbi:MAG: anti-sigma factor [Alicyclobacillus sp.]|nr:anti-sigma factor [Alicyclobacillus sp.]